MFFFQRISAKNFWSNVFILLHLVLSYLVEALAIVENFEHLVPFLLQRQTPFLRLSTSHKNPLFNLSLMPLSKHLKRYSKYWTIENMTLIAMLTMPYRRQTAGEPYELYDLHAIRVEVKKTKILQKTSPHCPIICDSQRSFEEEELTIWNPQVEIQFQLQALRIPSKLQFQLRHFKSKEIARPD